MAYDPLAIAEAIAHELMSSNVEVVVSSAAEPVELLQVRLLANFQTVLPDGWRTWPVEQLEYVLRTQMADIAYQLRRLLETELGRWAS